MKNRKKKAIELMAIIGIEQSSSFSSARSAIVLRHSLQSRQISLSIGVKFLFSSIQNDPIKNKFNSKTIRLATTTTSLSSHNHRTIIKLNQAKKQV
ncbi:hypothetical protein NH340_JMT02619 [Sarcoptes scabiei]|nr:hypothetical protein NH340_JMT02619 [Sarcoptes scabiei]